MSYKQTNRTAASKSGWQNSAAVPESLILQHGSRPVASREVLGVAQQSRTVTVPSTSVARSSFRFPLSELSVKSVTHSFRRVWLELCIWLPSPRVCVCSISFLHLSSTETPETVFRGCDSVSLSLSLFSLLFRTQQLLESRLWRKAKR